MNQSSHYGFWVVHILGNVGSIPKNSFLGPIWRAGGTHEKNVEGEPKSKENNLKDNTVTEYEYEACSRNLVGSSEKCSRPEVPLKWIQCDLCNRWYHVKCVEIPAKKVSDEIEIVIPLVYKCHHCKTENENNDEIRNENQVTKQQIVF